MNWFILHFNRSSAKVNASEARLKSWLRVPFGTPDNGVNALSFLKGFRQVIVGTEAKAFYFGIEVAGAG